MEKGEKQSTSSTPVINAALNEKKEIGLIKIKGTSYFENLSAVVRTNFTNRVANVLEIKSDSKVCWFGDAKW